MITVAGRFRKSEQKSMAVSQKNDVSRRQWAENQYASLKAILTATFNSAFTTWNFAKQ
jgi:hypothetical protein